MNDQHSIQQAPYIVIMNKDIQALIVKTFVCRVWRFSLRNEDFIQNNRSVFEIDSLFDPHSFILMQRMNVQHRKILTFSKDIHRNKITRRTRTSTVRHKPTQPRAHATTRPRNHSDHTTRTAWPALRIHSMIFSLVPRIATLLSADEPKS